MATNIPCPEDNRRTSQELYIKLVVVFFTVLSSLFHLIHVRRDYGVAVILILFTVISPMTVAVYLVGPLPLLLIQMVIYRDVKLLRQSLAALIGHIPKNVEESGSDVERSTLLGPENPESARLEQKKWTFSWPKIARSLALLAVFGQSVTSIWLYDHRPWPVALYDHYVLQLAIIGMLSSGLSLLHIWLNPIFPGDRWDSLDSRVSWLAWFRPISNHHDDSTDFFNSVINLIGFTLLGTVVSTVASSCHLKIVNGLTTTMEVSGVYLTDMGNLFKFLGPYIGFGAALVILLFARYIWKERYMMVKGLVYPLTYILICVLCFPTLILIFDIVAFILRTSFFNYNMLQSARGDGWVSGGAHFCPSDSDLDRIANYNILPTQCPCQQVLKDPIADKLWALA